MFKYKKIFFILLCILVLFGFSNKNFAHAMLKFESYTPHKCFDDILIPFSEIDPSMDDVYVKCTCHLRRPISPPLPKRNKIYYTNRDSGHHHLFFNLWQPYVKRYGGEFVYYCYSVRNDNKWEKKFFRKRHGGLTNCVKILMHNRKKFEELADKKRKDVK